MHLKLFLYLQEKGLQSILNYIFFAHILRLNLGKHFVTHWQFGRQEMQSGSHLLGYLHLNFIPLKILRIVFIFTGIVIKKKSVDLFFLYFSVAMMGVCTYASVCLQNKDLILSRLDSLLYFPNQS